MNELHELHNMNNIYHQFKTGDILLFDSYSDTFDSYSDTCNANANGNANMTGNSWLWKLFSNLIKWSTDSSYTHIAMILKDPIFIHPSLKGLFVWESGWENGIPDPQDNKIKLGVQITPLHEIIYQYKNISQGKCYYRSIFFDDGSGNFDYDTYNSYFSVSNLTKIHKMIYNKPYDLYPSDWIHAYFRKDDNPQKTSRFWCSALIGYIYHLLHIVESDMDWSILRPSDFSYSYDNQFLYFLPNIRFHTKEIEF